LVLGVGSVSAAPADKFTIELNVTCPELGGSLVTVEMDSSGLARFIQGTNRVLVVASFEGEVTIDGVAYPIEYSPSEQRFEYQAFTTCSVSGTAVRPKSGEVFTVVATMHVIATPRGQ